MKQKIYIILTVIAFVLFGLSSIAQNSDWLELQGKIDSAVRTNGIVRIERNYRIDRPLVAANWDGTDYKFFTIQIIGNATMWDVQGASKITATFDDAPILSIHKGKGCIVKGINLTGATSNGRESQFSPYAAIAIDPFRYNLPPDSGYPTLRHYYRGLKTVSGSTGCRFEDITVNKVTVGFITSPNGYTLNAELMTFQNIRSYDVKYVFAGCQAQEKMNRVINLGSWGPSHTIFMFNKFGECRPGNWIIDGVNIAGGVYQLINRNSTSYFPVYISNVFAESLYRIGEWNTTMSDALSNSSINFRYVSQVGAYPGTHLGGSGLTLNNCQLRYYGDSTPILLAGTVKISGGDARVITGKYDYDQTQVIQIGRVTPVIENNRCVITGTGRKVGDIIYFMSLGNWAFTGMGQVDSVGTTGYGVRYISNEIKSGTTYRIGVKR